VLLWVKRKPLGSRKELASGLVIVFDLGFVIGIFVAGNKSNDAIPVKFEDVQTAEYGADEALNDHGAGAGVEVGECVD